MSDGRCSKSSLRPGLSMKSDKELGKQFRRHGRRGICSEDSTEEEFLEELPNSDDISRKCVRLCAGSTPDRKAENSVDRQPRTNRMRKKSSGDGAKRTTRMRASAPMKKNPVNDVSQQLSFHKWYHGMMPRVESEELVKNQGDFLVRKTSQNGTSIFCLTIRWELECHHQGIVWEKKSWSVDPNIHKPTIGELIEHHLNNRIPVQEKGTLLINPIPRPDFLIMHDHITSKQKLGSGAFGDVFRGEFRKHDDERTILNVDCALKKLKASLDKQKLEKFMSEASLMRRFEHPNIVRVYGVAIQEEPVMIVLEFAANGCLKNYFKAHPDDDWERMMGFSRDAARGMAYLAQREVIHRDLAARNCLLGSKNELKIGDFGLSVKGTEMKTNFLKSMPIKWCAPEVFSEGTFSQKTDVWAFGVLMWEIFNKCRTDPFPEDNNAQAMVKIKSGAIPMELPLAAPIVAHNVMKNCFIFKSSDRPDFLSLFGMLAPSEEPPRANNPNELLNKMCNE